MISFTFYFYDLPSHFGHPLRIRKGISASDGPNGRYSNYFHSLATILTNDNIAKEAEAILNIERGAMFAHEIADCGWVITVNSREVEFQSDDYEYLNNGDSNIFTFTEFKWIFMAWWEFLLMPDQAGGVKYKFTLPIGSSCSLERPDKLLIPTD
jgi:hypothetical protein